MAINETEEKKEGLSVGPQETPEDTSDHTQTEELPTIVPYIKNLQEKIGKLTDVIKQKQLVLNETSKELVASNSLKNNFQYFESEVGEYIGLLLEKTHLGEGTEQFNDLKELLENDHDENMTKLMLYCKNGELEEVKQFDNEFFDSEKIWENALFLAFQNGHKELVAYILATKKAKIDINLQEYCYYFSQLKEKNLINKCRIALKAVINADIAHD